MIKIISTLTILIALSGLSFAGEVKKIVIQDIYWIEIGDTADRVFSILDKSDVVSREQKKDPYHPGSFIEIKYYKVEGKSFTIHFARVLDPGPYEVVKIITHP